MVSQLLQLLVTGTFPTHQVVNVSSYPGTAGSFDSIALGICVHHTLHANIFVQPNTPVDLILVINTELFAQQIESVLVDARSIGIVGGICIYGTELAVPNGSAISSHEVGLTNELTFHFRLLFWCALERCTCREAH